MNTEVYQPKHHIRFVTAASLFDGHDVSINIIRRILQSTGAEVIHLGHNRSVWEVVETAIQENVQGIAVSSYQGGHMEYLTYLYDLLREHGVEHIRVFAGGGGVFTPDEITELEAYGISKVFSPDDGMRLGLQGMVNYMLELTDFPPIHQTDGNIYPTFNNQISLAQVLSFIEENKGVVVSSLVQEGSVDQLDRSTTNQNGEGTAPAIGITGTGGAGKSTLTDELVRRFLNDFADIHIAILSVDPSKRASGGALLGDRIRMNSITGAQTGRVYMRSFATRQAHRSVSTALKEAIEVCRDAGFDLIILETAGIGQSDTEVTDLADVTLYVMTHDFGAPTQLEKIGMLDIADIVVLNKFEKRGSQDALRDVRKQIKRNRHLWEINDDDLPVFPTMASHFNDVGVTRLYLHLLEYLNRVFGFDRRSTFYSDTGQELDPLQLSLFPPKRQRYLGEIVDACKSYRGWAEKQIEYACKWGQAAGARVQVESWAPDDRIQLSERLDQMAQHWWNKLDARSRYILDHWEEMAARYLQETITYRVRDKQINVPLFSSSLSGTKIPRVVLPKVFDPGERLRFALLENLPGFFPFTAGVFPFKRTNEDPTRMFAGEGCPERTNRRFHLVSEGMPAKRLSTAFDSVTLYGFDPAERPDIYGKIGNAGVSICTLVDMKKLYSGFNLCDPKTSVSMTINGPASMALAMFMNTAIDQQVELYLKQQGRWDETKNAVDEKLGTERPDYVSFGPGGIENGLPRSHDGFGLGLLGAAGSDLIDWELLGRDEYESIKTMAIGNVRGTVQADILKEDQAQNTCIFSTDFALRVMGDIQQYFVNNDVRNFYSVSISGYHIAEAGANPISQLAFTLANGFTYVEYYLSRGMPIDSFAPNLSFFFSNGMDPEYSVIGRVARRIWAVTMREKYGGNERSQKLKYHIQTSGRSLHAQEIQFNDIRTTLQALMAIYDNCNSLHTNAYDEAITTPTEESVRRAIAIQMIINHELGLAKNENPLQGSYIIDTLTDLVEEAVLLEFERINDRGGVLGAMESMYQRGKIQQESMFYEHQKHSGALPLIGVNTFLSDNGAQQNAKTHDLMRSSEEEKQHQLHHLRLFKNRNKDRSDMALVRLQQVARDEGNIFEELMESVKVCSLGQITQALFEVGGQYRRNM